MDVRYMLRKVGRNAAPGAHGQADQAIGDSERLAMLDAFEEAEIGWFWATNSENELIYLSRSAIEKFGPGTEVLHQPLSQLVETVDENGETGGDRPLSFFLGSRSRFSDLTVRLRGPETETWWLVTGRPYYDAEDNFCGFRGSAKDVTRQFARQRDDTRLAQFDALTGLANRHRMETRLEAVLASFRAAKRSCALLMMDLDKFKQVNDTLGHPAGDELLRQVAQRLQRIVNSPAEIGRLGGDEFQIIIPDMDDRGHLGDLAQKIIKIVSQPYALGSDRASIGASIGIAIAPYDGVSSKELVKSADLALYAAKGGGRGQYRFYASDLASAAQRQREMGEDLRLALERNELGLHYQPIVRAADNRVVGFEALLRWNHPQLGQVSPDTFIPIAEDTNLIHRIGEWVVHKACEDGSQWPAALRVAVNVSAQQFLAGGLLASISNALEKSGLPPSRLELEVPEGVFMGESSTVDGVFAKLSKLGVSLALDDFGTGYSSLTYLRRAPFEKIKIDRSFVRGAAEKDSSNAAIITAIVSLASALGMQTTAEGVEAMDELELVKARGATQIQGFIFSRAVPQTEVLAKLESGDFTYDPAGPQTHRAERRTVYKRIGVIHEDHRYQAVLRNLSRTGAMIEGLLNVPVGTDLVLDLGHGQLAVATVRRSQDATQGVEFETPLIDDGAGGLCTRHRVSPYALAAAGMPLTALDADTSAPVSGTGAKSRPRFMEVDASAGSSRAA